jgi:hypothetical protein
MGARQVSIRPQASVSLIYVVRPSKLGDFEVESTDDDGCSRTTHGFTTETDVAAWIAEQQVTTKAVALFLGRLRDSA